MGILCTHALGAIKVNNVLEIPYMYLLKRWIMEAVLMTRINNKFFPMNGSRSQLAFTNCAMHFAYDIITRSAPHETKRNMVWNALEDMSALVDDVSKENEVIQKKVLVNNASNKDNNDKFEDDGTTAILNLVKIRSKRGKRGCLKAISRNEEKIIVSR
ncbi:hypothetical protein ACH5RR_023310 [Cinchona calisaya]|uniref:Protein FAR1-RELATED SEQUENCE n=1 Tax=Cinchona calisaya TaxID=153742 RepID=A0ABD2ZFA8_9GENT